MNNEKILVLRTQRLWHESRCKEQRIEMTMRDLMTEMGALLMYNYTPSRVSIDGGRFEQNMHPEDPASPEIITFEVIEYPKLWCPVCKEEHSEGSFKGIMCTVLITNKEKRITK